MDKNNNKCYEVAPRILHENENYYVQPLETVREDVFIIDSLGAPYTEGYGLVNRDTGQIELVRPCLPDIIYNAEHLNKILVEKSYQWLEMNAPEEVPSSGTAH